VQARDAAALAVYLDVDSAAAPAEARGGDLQHVHRLLGDLVAENHISVGSSSLSEQVAVKCAHHAGSGHGRLRLRVCSV
jgi:hypothetical protein